MIPAPVPFRQRHAGSPNDRVGAHQALGIGGGNVRRAFRVEAGEFDAKRLAAKSRPLGPRFGDGLGRWRRNVGDSLDQSLEIKPGSAHDDGQPPKAAKFLDGLEREP